MSAVTLVEVGLRDGLQNESVILSRALRLELAQKLVAAGFRRLELGAFVRADRVPQMADSGPLIHEFVAGLSPTQKKKVQGSVLVPNLKGLEEALQTPLKEFAVFGSASETFSQKNINCSIEESFRRFAGVLAEAKKKKIKVRGYLSCCFGCPYEGKIRPANVVKLATRLYKMGCYEISIGDTIGVATPEEVRKLFLLLKKKIPVKALAGHFHDTRGTALANIWAAYGVGVRVFDTSIGGLGGCPYAPGASGNVSTEDVAYMFKNSGIKTGLNLESLIQTNQWLLKTMGKELSSKVGKAGILRPLAPKV